MRQEFAIGFLIGFVGGCLGVLLAGVFGREYLTGAVAGFATSVVAGMLLGAAFSVPMELAGPQTEAPVSVDPSGLRRINMDGTPVSESPMGPNLALLMAAVIGVGVAAVGAMGAVFMFLGGGSRGGDAEPEARSVY